MNTDIGVIQQQSSQASRAPAGVTSAACFTQNIAERYSSRAVIASGADLALAFESPGETHHYYRSEHYWSLPPIAFLNESRERPADTGAARSSQTNRNEAAAIRLFERIFTRSGRIAAFDAPLSSTAPAGTALPGIAPRTHTTERFLPPVRKADSISAPSGKPDTSSSATFDASWGTPAAFHESPKPVTLQPPEIRRVADQVMRDIDHRIVARRERMGGR
jgi:hypothetical protein